MKFTQEVSLVSLTTKERQARNAKKYRDAHLQECKDRERKWRTAHKATRAAAARRRRVANPEKEKKYIRFRAPLYKSKYEAARSGHIACTATPQEIKAAYTGFCFACGAAEGKRLLHMDHNHKTGQFRGWLCGQCNTALGMLEDSLNRITQLEVYLQRQDSNRW